MIEPAAVVTMVIRYARTRTHTMMTAEAAQALARKLVQFLESGDVPEGLFTQDVFCDFTMSRWRLQARGVDGTVALRKQGHPGPGSVPRWRCKLSVYCTGDWDEDRRAEHARAVQLLRP